LIDALLGQHAIIFCVIAYVSVKLHRQVRLFSVWQQAVAVFGVVTLSQLLWMWIRSIFGHPQIFGFFIFPAFTSMLLWPWLFIILRDLRRSFHVS
ncbi:MAG: rod shape-determining protein MreD, partial [Thiomargarita sp.]|nr:rod shape-determining protein MreD [Thiomargarita sp.]